MGGNLSRVDEVRAQAVPSAYIKPQNRVPYPSSAPYPPTYNTSTNYNYHRNNNFNNKFSDYELPPYSDGRPMPSSATMANTNRVITFHSAALWREYFEASQRSNKLVIIYFTATWCGPCKHMEPTIRELAAKYNDIDIVKIDVDELFNLSRDFGVQTMPTFMFIKRGKQIDKVVGANKDDLRIKIEKHRF